MKNDAAIRGENRNCGIVIHCARIACGPRKAEYGSIEIDGGCIHRFAEGQYFSSHNASTEGAINLSGFLILPGLINSHDHLGFAPFPRLGDPPYRNYVEWGNDIHDQFPDVIARYRAIPKRTRLWWGGIRNLLCGVTTVYHHDPLWPDLLGADFPVRVIRQDMWAHSLAYGGDLSNKRATLPKDSPFILHACEGVDDAARAELWELDRLGLLDSRAVLVHGLAIDSAGAALMNARQASLIVCPSSNHFLFGTLPDMAVLSRIGRAALGSDSPLTAAGDLLDEIRFAIDLCAISPESAYRMVTTAPAGILKLRNCEGTITEGGVADLVAIRDAGADPADRLQSLSIYDIELVMIGGRVQLASGALFDRLPASEQQGLERLSIGEVHRWLRAPIEDLLRSTEEVLGTGQARLGDRTLLLPAYSEAQHAG
jgi:cytosine/adenosine deaminase-related metal-dependent hydrolase